MPEKDFNYRLERKKEKLRGIPFRRIEAEAADKRMRWFDDIIGGRGRKIEATPRGAYELLLLEYLNISPEAVPVVSESTGEIVWHSLNACPTLEACLALGMDTREVCRSAYEKPAQLLISRIDPQLRFLRSYEEIRPLAEHCRETIFRLDFEELMGMALEEAGVSLREGNKGYGAVVVFGDEIIGRAHDRAVIGGDPSLHAEFTAIRQAVRAKGDPDLCGGVLFSTCEPCPMCTGLAVWSNLTTIVYGASIEETSRLGRKRITVGTAEIIDRSPVTMEVIGGVLRENCLHLYS